MSRMLIVYLRRREIRRSFLNFLAREVKCLPQRRGRMERHICAITILHFGSYLSLSSSSDAEITTGAAAAVTTTAAQIAAAVAETKINHSFGGGFGFRHKSSAKSI